MSVIILPLEESPKHTYLQICQKICKYYGVADAEHWFMLTKRRIMDRCLPDRWKFNRFDTLLHLWETRQLEYKFSHEKESMMRTDESLKTGIAQPVSAKHTVELYRVRGAGSNGEIGVLTTAHDLDTFISGLASACAQFVQGGGVDKEHELLWIFKNSFPVAFKLAGYKADQVIERHVFMCGSNAPAADDIIASA